MTTITDGSTTVTPDLVLQVTSSQDGGSIVHDIIGGGTVMTQRPALARTGTLTLFFLTEEQAEACRALHATGAQLQYDEPEHPSRALSYTATSIGPALDDATRKRWTVDVGFREVTG
ncbi:hypothetical protein [Gryllotalpicola koreensis]|uniref:Uncharacterized protein n=1 Tax=Gryllotalpicola koreensis TaxID=993086 RepID=A0ABP8A6M6_9MICO